MTIDQQYFGFSARPFHLTPDPDFWFESTTHRRAMAYLSFGLTLGEGFIVITGDIGSGKTTLLGALLRTLDPMRVDAVPLDVASLGDGAVLDAIAAALGVKSATDPVGLSVSSMIKEAVDAKARMGRRLLFVVDEAQALSRAELEQLRLVSNAHPGHVPVVQFLLLGQPELGDVLADPSLEQLRQRVIASHHLTGMDPDEVLAYVEHRLRHVGWMGTPALDAAAAQRLAVLTDGLPRRINQMMTRALMLAAMSQASIITADMIDEVAAEQSAEWDRAAQISPSAAASDAISELSSKLADLDRRLAEQEAALRHILTLLSDWVDSAEAQAQRLMARS